MDGPKHYTEAEVIAEQAEAALRRGDPDHLAAAWVALAQVHAHAFPGRRYRCRVGHG
jgi:hypothetical protein